MRHRPAGPLHLVGARGQYFIYQTIRYRIFGRHEIITLGVYFNALDRLASAFSQNGVEARTQTQDLASLNLDVGSLSLSATGRLVDHDARIGQCIPLALRTCSK